MGININIPETGISFFNRFFPIVIIWSLPHCIIFTFAKCNTEEQQELAGTFGIRSIPTLAVFREKILLLAQPGALPESALDEIIEKVKTLDMEEIREKVAEQEASAGGGGAGPEGEATD